RLIQDQDGGWVFHPSADDDLLLIAPGEGLDRALGILGLDREAPQGASDDVPTAAAVDPDALDPVLGPGEGKVVAQGLGDHQTLAFPVLGDQGEPRRPRVGRAAQSNWPAANEDLARSGRIDPAQGPGQFGPSRADQSGEAQDLAGAELEA